jgi:hypothetical protein
MPSLNTKNFLMEIKKTNIAIYQRKKESRDHCHTNWKSEVIILDEPLQID